jgi:hypothetical protein
VSGRKPKFKSWPLRSGEVANQRSRPTARNQNFNQIPWQTNSSGELLAARDVKNWALIRLLRRIKRFLRFKKNQAVSK